MGSAAAPLPTNSSHALGCLPPCSGPRPPIGVHRYIFLLYKQPGAIEFVDPTGGGRRKFKTRPTAAAHGLGQPVAVTYFNSAAPAPQ